MKELEKGTQCAAVARNRLQTSCAINMKSCGNGCGGGSKGWRRKAHERRRPVVAEIEVVVGMLGENGGGKRAIGLSSFHLLVEAVFHGLRPRIGKNTPASKCSWSELGAVCKKANSPPVGEGPYGSA